MKGILSIFVAAATAIGASAATFAPSQAAPIAPMRTVLTDQGGTIVEVGGRHDRRHGDDRWRYRHHRHQRDRDFFPGFYFGFGAPFAPRAYYSRPYQPYYGYGDCFRTWDGQVICR